IGQKHREQLIAAAPPSVRALTHGAADQEPHDDAHESQLVPRERGDAEVETRAERRRERAQPERPPEAAAAGTALPVRHEAAAASRADDLAVYFEVAPGDGQLTDRAACGGRGRFGSLGPIELKIVPPGRGRWLVAHGPLRARHGGWP